MLQKKLLPRAMSGVTFHFCLYSKKLPCMQDIPNISNFQIFVQKNILYFEIQTGDHPSPAKLIERRELCLEKLGRFNEEIQVLETIVEDLSKDGDLRNSEIIAENEEKIKQLLIAGDANLIEVLGQCFPTKAMGVVVYFDQRFCCQKANKKQEICNKFLQKTVFLSLHQNAG